jgi:voltage-gated potassium channel
MRDERDALHGYQLFMLVFCVVALLLLGLERALPLDESVSHLIQYADFLICLVFLADFVHSLATAPDRWRYLRTWGWIDLLSSIPAVDALRVGRGARILRIVRVLRGVKATRVIASFLFERRTESAVMAATLLFILVLFAGSVGVLHFEQAQPGATIANAEDAAWWAFVTITTVGYGDRVPVSSEGRVVAVLLMMSGVLLVGTLSGLAASWFLAPTARKNRGEIEALSQEVARLRDVLERLASGAASPSR